MSFHRCEGHSAGTDRGDEKAEKNGENKNKFVPKSKRFLLVSGPLHMDGDAEDDEEDTEEERLENEAEEACC